MATNLSNSPSLRLSRATYERSNAGQAHLPPADHRFTPGQQFPEFCNRCSRTAEHHESR